jgi:hypothetical protein
MMKSLPATRFYCLKINDGVFQALSVKVSKFQDSGGILRVSHGKSSTVVEVGYEQSGGSVPSMLPTQVLSPLPYFC